MDGERREARDGSAPSLLARRTTDYCFRPLSLPPHRFAPLGFWCRTVMILALTVCKCFGKALLLTSRADLGYPKAAHPAPTRSHTCVGPISRAHPHLPCVFASFALASHSVHTPAHTPALTPALIRRTLASHSPHTRLTLGSHSPHLTRITLASPPPCTH